MKDPHNYERRLKGVIRRIKEDYGWLSEEEKEALLKFKDQCLLNISTCRTVRYLMSLKKVTQEWLDVDLTEAKKSDLKRAVGRIMKTDYSHWTKKFYKIALRKFYQWEAGYEWDEKYPEKVSWVTTTTKKNNKKLPSELLTKKEIKKLIKAANKARNRALVAVLYESGCRIGELMKLQVKDVEFDNKPGAKIHVNGKTGGRVIRIVSSVPYLQEWLNEHPDSDKKESPVWRNLYKNEVLSYNRIRAILKEIKERTDVNKPVNPHNFRHSRATHLANEFTESQLCQYFGWVQGSKQAATYVHLSGRDMDDAVLKMYGLGEVEDEEDNELEPIKCPRCGKVNEATNHFCKRCGMPLDKEGTEKTRELETEDLEIAAKEEVGKKIIAKLLEDEEVQEVISKKMEEKELLGKATNL